MTKIKYPQIHIPYSISVSNKNMEPSTKLLGKLLSDDILVDEKSMFAR
jgi:hypothetical protein